MSDRDFKEQLPSLEVLVGAVEAEQSRQQWLLEIDQRIKAFQEHCRRSEGQRVRFWMAAHKARIKHDLAVLQGGIDDMQLRRSANFGHLWSRGIDGKWRKQQAATNVRMRALLDKMAVGDNVNREYPTPWDPV